MVNWSKELGGGTSGVFRIKGAALIEDIDCLTNEQLALIYIAGEVKEACVRL